MAALNVYDYICLINVTKVKFVRKKMVSIFNGPMWFFASAYSPRFFLTDVDCYVITSTEHQFDYVTN